MTRTETQMRAEISEIPAAVERLLTEGEVDARRVANAIAHADPRFVETVARGSSDHVCTYLKYAFELMLGLPVASIGPSVASVYKAPLKLENSLCLSVSQSGKSPDIVALAKSARAAGSYSVAITNDNQSPLATCASATLDIHAGPEQSVAATKTFVTSAVAGLRLVALLSKDADLQQSIVDLPETLNRALQADWSPLLDAIQGGSLYTIGRGPALAIANEAALKLKETCQIHAESYSSAEILHGPVSIVDDGFAILAFAASDAAEGAVTQVADSLAASGARAFLTSTAQSGPAIRLPTTRSGHWLTDSIALIVSFYSLVEQLAAQRGLNPDTPRNLNKVTETV